MAKDDGSLKYHQGKSHKHIGRYFCDECDASFTENPKLTNHILTRHRGFTHNCNMCAYKAFGTSSLKKHIEREHDGTRFMCDKCDIMFKGRYNLSNHIRIKHEGFRFTCDICDYKVTQKRVLDKHQRENHNTEMPLQNTDQGVHVTHMEKENITNIHESEVLENEKNHGKTNIGPENKISKEGVTNIKEWSCKEKLLEKSDDWIIDHVSENQPKPINLNIYEDTEYEDIVEDIDYEKTFDDVEHKSITKEVGVPAVENSNNNPDNSQKQVNITENSKIIVLKASKYCEIYKTNQIKMTDRTRSLGCDKCNFKCLEKNQMVYHKEIHNDYDLFDCSQCNYSANYQSHLLDHTEAIHTAKIYQCNQCSYEATCRSDLAHHNTWIHKLEDGDEEYMFID
jgi:KRAB domain-containing zinc finger protein